VEFDQASVIGALYDAPVMGGESPVDQIAAQAPEARERPVLVCAGHPAVTDDIRNQDCREPSQY